VREWPINCEAPTSKKICMYREQIIKNEIDYSIICVITYFLFVTGYAVHFCELDPNLEPNKRIKKRTRRRRVGRKKRRYLENQKERDCQLRGTDLQAELPQLDGLIFQKKGENDQRRSSAGPECPSRLSLETVRQCEGSKGATSKLDVLGSKGRGGTGEGVASGLAELQFGARNNSGNASRGGIGKKVVWSHASHKEAQLIMEEYLSFATPSCGKSKTAAKGKSVLGQAALENAGKVAKRSKKKQKMRERTGKMWLVSTGCLF